jgi:casein kinase 1
LIPGGHHTGNATGQRPRERAHRASNQPVQPGALIPPSPALVRHGSKQRKHTSNAAVVGGPTMVPPSSNVPTNVAQVSVSQIPYLVILIFLFQQQLQQPSSPQQSPVNPQHPYATPMYSSPYPNQGSHGRQGSYTNAINTAGNAYGRSSAVPTATTGMSPALVNNVRARAGEPGIANTPGFDGMQRGIDEEPVKKKSFFDLILCRCG